MHELEKNNDRLDQLLDESLRLKPVDFLGENFSDKLVKRIDNIYAWKSSMKEFIWMVGAVILPIVILLGIAYFLQIDLWQQAKDLFANHWPTVFMGVTVGITILFYDRVLLRFFQRKINKK